MRKRSFIVAGAMVVVMLARAGALYAYVRSQRDVIAHGIRVEGIDIGGLTAAQARARLNREYLPRLGQPVVARFHAYRFILVPRSAHVAVDIDATVERALQLSRDGTIFGWVWRSLRGGHVNADLQPRIAFSRAAVGELVGRVTRTLDHPARDATVSYSPDSLGEVPARTGLALQAGALSRAVDSALEHPTAGHDIAIPATVITPKVSTSQLARHYPTVITIDRGRFQLRLWKHLRLVRSYPIAVGMQRVRAFPATG